jgi:hypothetical protein
MNQYLIDYTVRNITTGDEEDIRVLELEPAEYDGFPESVREQIRSLVADCNWGGTTMWPVWHENRERIVELLMPFISGRRMFNGNYERWERELLHRTS